MNFISKYLFNKDQMSKKDYRYARVGFMAESAFYNSSLSLLLTGAYLTGLLALLGATEAQTNLILSISTPIAFLQLLIPTLLERFQHKKIFIFLGRFFEIPLLAVCFLMPLIIGETKLAVLYAGILILLKHVFGWIYNPLYSDMLIKCLAKHGGIGNFSGIQTAVNNVVTCIALFLAGYIMKSYTGEVEKYGYMWLAIVALILWVGQTVFFFFIKEPYTPLNQNKPKTKLAPLFKAIFTNRSIRSYLMFDTPYTIGTNLAQPLTNIMCVQRLGMSLEIMSYITILELVLRVLLLPIFGRLTDILGAKKMMTAGAIFLAASYALHGVMTTENMIFLKITASVFSSTGFSLISAAFLSFIFESLPEENRPSYLACISTTKNFLSCAISFSATFFISAAAGMSIPFMGIVFTELNTMLFLGAIITILALIPMIRKKPLS